MGVKPVLVAQGFYWNRCTAILIDVHTLGAPAIGPWIIQEFSGNHTGGVMWWTSFPSPPLSIEWQVTGSNPETGKSFVKQNLSYEGGCSTLTSLSHQNYSFFVFSPSSITGNFFPLFNLRLLILMVENHNPQQFFQSVFYILRYTKNQPSFG